MLTTENNAGAGLPGRFWLQGEDEGKAIPGRLFLQAGDNPRLEVDGALTQLEREVSREKLPDGTELRTSTWLPPQEMVSQSLTVHGTLETGEPVTLPCAFTVGWSKRGTGAQSHRLQAFYALAGAHVEGADAQFTRIRVRLRHLDAWAALPGFTFTPDLSAGKSTLTFEPPDVPFQTLANGARITLEQESAWGLPTVCGGKLERRLWADVLDIPPATYHDLDRKIVKPLMNLLTFAVGAVCPLVAMEISAGPDHPWLTVHHAAMKEPAEEIIPPHRMLLPLTQIGLRGIAAWLDSMPRLGPLPSIVARAVNPHDDTVEAQLLELTTVAEGLHRLLLPKHERMTKEQAAEARSKALDAIKDLCQDVRDAVKAALGHLTDQSYPRRLLDLANHIEEAVPGVTGNTVKWKKHVTDARNNLAHKLEHGFLDDDIDAQEYAAVLTSLRWLLTGMLLLQTRISPAALGSRMRDHQPYQLFLLQARIWLPAVYNSAESPAR